MNYLLENIEIHLLKKKIPYTKHLGILLLNKPHIKDFIAFIIVSYNPKSSIHWKRILCLNNNYSMNEVNELFKSTKNIINT